MDNQTDVGSYPGTEKMNQDHLKAVGLLQDPGSQNTINNLLDAVNSGIIILDKHENMVFFNSRARKLLGIEKGQLDNRHISQIFMPDDRKILVPNILSASRNAGEFEGEFLLRRMPNSSFMALFSCHYWKQGSDAIYIITFNDISALKKVERMLEQSERMVYLGRMLDDISHQIRNPVLAIGGFSRRLLKTRLEKPEYVNVILDESRRLEMLLDVLTEFIQLPKPRFSAESSEKIWEISTRLAREITAQFDVELRTKGPEKIPGSLVITDTILFRRALEPVVVNACEVFLESDRKPVVTLKFSAPLNRAGGMQIEISDPGPGIRPPLLSRIFHPFFSTKTGHLGMGLTFTRQIMEELGGSVETASSVNQGTTVTMRLPGDRRRPIRTTPLEETAQGAPDMEPSD